MRRGVLVSMFAAALAAGSCGPRANPQPARSEPTVAWHRLGSWSGRGSLQTESFTSDTGTLRVSWETTSADGPVAIPLFGASALLSVLTSADGWLVVPEEATGLPAGSQVDVTLYR